jgi:Protein of unknown function (DUF4012)
MPKHRRWGWGVLVAFGILSISVALAVVPALGARARLLTGRDELENARELLLSGDLGAASAAFGRAEDAFDEAGGYARSPVLRLAGSVPLAGRSFDAVVVLADAGRLAASAGSDLADGIERLPDGIAELAPSNGTIPVEQIEAFHPAISDARAKLAAALAGVRSLPTSWIVGPVADARDRSIALLEEATGTATAADALAGALPGLVGSEGERRYFVAAQTPAELRGTGGFMGAYTILTADGGRLRFDRVHNITELRDLSPKQAPPAPDGFGEPFARFGGTGFWRNLNMDPHAPTVGRLIEALYERVTGVPIHGVIFVDPQALADMLEATGPIDAPTLDRTLEASTVVDYLANEAYGQFGSAAERKRVLGAAVLSVLRRFLGGTDPVASFRALADAGAGGHLIVYSRDPEVQAALEAAGVAGTVEAPQAGDLFGAFASNADGTKIDFYVRRSLSYRVDLGEGGGSTAQVALTAENTAPTDPEQSYVFGPYPGTGLAPGVSQAFLSMYCAPDCGFQDATLDGKPQSLGLSRERGLSMFSTYVQTAPGTTSELALELRRADAWTGDELGGTYHLRIRAQQPVLPTRGTISIQAPPGTNIVDATPGMLVEGGSATWDGDLDAVQDFEIRFQRPPSGRFWDWLSTPVFGD